MNRLLRRLSMVHRALLAILLTIAGISLAHAETLEPADSLSVPSGTVLHCRTNQTLTTKLNIAGDNFTFNVAEPVAVKGSVAIPAGSTLAGRVTLVERPGRIKGVGLMRLTLDRITLPNNQSFPVNATLLTAYGLNRVKVVESEGIIKGPSSRVPDVEEIGAGTAGGALLGLIFAHPFVGALAGATVATVDRLRRRGKDLTIPIGTGLDYELTRELTLAGSAVRTTAANRVPQAGR